MDKETFVQLKLVTADVLCGLLMTNYSSNETNNSYTLTLNLPNSKFYNYEREMKDELIYLLHESKFFQFSNNKLTIYYAKDKI